MRARAPFEYPEISGIVSKENGQIPLDAAMKSLRSVSQKEEVRMFGGGELFRSPRVYRPVVAGQPRFWVEKSFWDEWMRKNKDGSNLFQINGVVCTVLPAIGKQPGEIAIVPLSDEYQDGRAAAKA